jgi:LPXTG-motif cell wall-anchored protein
MRRLLILLPVVLALLVVTAPAALAVDRDCKDFSSQAAAQAYFDANGGSPSNNVDNLDADHDGQACEAFAYATSSNQQANQGAAAATGGTLPRTGERDSLFVLAGLLLAVGAGTLLVTRYRPLHLRR